MRVFAARPFAVGALFFRDPTPRVALAVKATLRFARAPAPALSWSDAGAPLTLEGAIDPASGLPLRACDYAPRKVRAELMVVGSALSAQPATSVPLELGLGRALSKRAFALSSRAAQRIPLTPDSVRSERGEPSWLGPRRTPALAPAGPRDEREAWWSERWLDVSPLEVEARFQAAPRDQQSHEELGPGAQLSLSNLLAPSRLTLTLPRSWPWLVLLERGRELDTARPLALRLDTLQLDTDAETLDLTLRAELELGELPGYCDVLVGLGEGGEPISPREAAALLASTQPSRAVDPWVSSDDEPTTHGTLAPPAPAPAPAADDEDDDAPRTLTALITLPAAQRAPLQDLEVPYDDLEEDTSDRPTEHPPPLAAPEELDEDDSPTPAPRRAAVTEAPPAILDPGESDDDDEATGTGTVLGAPSPVRAALPFSARRDTQIPPPAASSSGLALPFSRRADTLPPAATPPDEHAIGTGTVLGAHSPAAAALPFSRRGAPALPTGGPSADTLGPSSRARAETLPTDRRAASAAALPFARSQRPPAPPPSVPLKPSSTMPPPPAPVSAAQPWVAPPPSVPFGFPPPAAVPVIAPAAGSAPATMPPPAVGSRGPSRRRGDAPKLQARDLAGALFAAQPPERARLLAALGTEGLGFARARAAWARDIDAELAEGSTRALDALLSALHAEEVAPRKA